MEEEVKYFEVATTVNYTLTKKIEAKTPEEAIEKAQELDPDAFENFNEFYEWLGFEWSNAKDGMTAEEL
ncbi:hypothetical protein LCGC14_1522130 [marine sediment metagenome]|uniref:Uncharacterized protein n=1 Tax=marine sediment metagenome TaxID=412755 RepID=A0A0F9LZE6_9ZZZZ